MGQGTGYDEAYSRGFAKGVQASEEKIAQIQKHHDFCNCVCTEVEPLQEVIQRVRLLSTDLSGMHVQLSSARVSDLILQALDTNEEWLVSALDGEQE